MLTFHIIPSVKQSQHAKYCYRYWATFF